MVRMRRSTLAMFTVLGLCMACTSPPAVNAPVTEVLKTWGRPTAIYALQPAGQRLEYASGPFGRTTWMVDVDAAGRVSQARQVLSEAEFFKLQSAPGLVRDDVLRWIGAPGEWRGARGGGQTWSWRYPTHDCLWFQLSLDPQGLVQGSGFFVDPVCDAPNESHNSARH